jgi:hypothetical protein
MTPPPAVAVRAEIEIAGSREGLMGTGIAAKEDERRDMALAEQDLELVAFRP